MNDIRICKMLHYHTPAAAGTMAMRGIILFTFMSLIPMHYVLRVWQISSILVILIRILPSGRGIEGKKKTTHNNK